MWVCLYQQHYEHVNNVFLHIRVTVVSLEIALQSYGTTIVTVVHY